MGGTDSDGDLQKHTSPPNSEGAKPSVERDEEQQKLRAAYVRAVMEKDMELLDLKRLHELSILRVGEGQRRHLSDYESRAVYFEECVARVSLDTVTVQEHTRKNVIWHAVGRAKLRVLKCALHLGVTLLVCLYLTYRYRWNSKRYYTPFGRRIWGSENFEPYDLMKKASLSNSELDLKL